MTDVVTSTSRTRHGFGPWRTIDLISATFVGVVFGVAYWGWDTLYASLSGPVAGVFGALQGILGGPWLMAGVVAALIIRRPGAALIAEVLASMVESLLGNQWGWATVISGALQGVGVELALALFLWRRFGPVVAMLAGATAALLEFGYEWHAYWQGTTTAFKVGYLLLFMASGAVVAGLGGWALTRALARTGAIDALPAGHEAARASAR
jgi:energy-coupling factor transport system substrate-specific component